MHVAHLSVVDFRGYPAVELSLAPGVTVFVGYNGQGKTNLVEAVGYLASQSSHRVPHDAPMVRSGAERAVVRGDIVHQDRHALIELEINPRRSNRARLNRAPVTRPRDVLGLLRTVLFAPEDLALVKGDPDTRRRFLDDLLVTRTPRLAGVRSDYDRVLRQRNTLLRTAGPAGRSGSTLGALDAWDQQLARFGGELIAARSNLVEQLRPPVAKAYAQVAAGSADVALEYKCSVGADVYLDQAEARGALAAALADRRDEELRRGVSLSGPHRDDLVIGLSGLPAKGYASHGESWSLALALKLAAYDLIGADGAEPVLILDDVFAELDTGRRRRLAALVAPAEQVLVTAAVDADVPAELRGVRYRVSEGEVRHVADAG